jgi:translation initiation factor 3 subunit C
MEESEEEDQPAKKIAFADDAKAAADEGGFTLVGKGGKAVEISKENLLKKLSDLLEERGKKSTDKLALIQNISGLLKASKSPYQSLKVLLALIPARFDYAPIVTGYTPVDIWKSALSEMKQLFDILEKYPKATVGVQEEDVDENSPVFEKVFFEFFFLS